MTEPRQPHPDHPRPATEHEHHRFESLAIFATVTRSPVLLRVHLAYLLFGMAELATWIAILVYAFDRGGATESGLVAFAQLAPAVVFAPVAAAFGDRLPRIRLLALAYGAYAASVLLVAALLLVAADALLVYGGAVIAGLALTLVRPAHASVLPTIARTPSELTAANVASGTVESVGVLVGSIGGGILLGLIGTGGVFLVSGLALVAGLLAVVGLRPAVAVRRRQRVELTLADVEGGPAGTMAALSEQDRVVVEHDLDLAAVATTRLPVVASPAVLQPPEVGATVSPPAVPGVMAEILAGIQVIRSDPHARSILVVLGLSMMVTGMLDVLGVVLALEVLDAGEEGVGLLSGVIGAGGLLGAAFAISLVGRHRLMAPLLVAALLVGLGVAASGLLPTLAVALAGFLAAGVGKSVFDVAGRTMLQRVAAEETMARTFGVLEGLNMAALAIGTLVAPLLVQALGSTLALVVAGAVVPAGVLVARSRLVRADAAGIVHERELALIRRIPMFAPLRVTSLERLAQDLDHLRVPAGADVVREGDEGDRFYVIGDGRCEVWVKGRHVNTIGAGDGFGEIALINDVPRTATVRALDEVELFVLDRAPFLEAITGQPRSRAAAQRLIDERLAMHA